MDGLPRALIDTVDYFARFPGVGKKTAMRMAFFLLQKTPEYHTSFAKSISSLSSSLGTCEHCFHLCDAGMNSCEICASPKRSGNQLCVVESSLDLLAMERSGCFSGKYFVLGGVISPMEGIGPDELRIAELVKMVQLNRPEEVIIALSSTMEGEATASYLLPLLQSSTKVSRIARGMPLGNLLQYTDENTLHRAFVGRS